MDQLSKRFLLPEWTLCPYQKLEIIQHSIATLQTKILQENTYFSTSDSSTTGCQCWWVVKQVKQIAIRVCSFKNHIVKTNILNCDSSKHDRDPVSEISLFITCILSGPGGRASDDALDLTPDRPHAAHAVIEVLAVPHTGIVQVPVEADLARLVNIVVLSTRMIANTINVDRADLVLVLRDREQNLRANSNQVGEETIDAVIG